MSLTLPERLSHLPKSQRCELERVARILFEEFAEAQKGKLSDKKKRGRILKLVLFGPLARHDWVRERRSNHRCGYDLLVVVSTRTFANPNNGWNQAAERFLLELTITKHLATPVNFLVHSIMDLNDQLALGRPFFLDIVRDGIMLYETPGFALAKPKPLNPALAKAEMRRHLYHWLPGAAHRLELAKAAIGRGYDKEAVFDLHQVTERLYHCALHVLTLYSPKSHRLTFLRIHAERVAPRLLEVWPNDSRFARQCFARLDRAYVDARYSCHYEITGDELAWLVERIEVLQETVAAICAAHLNDVNCAET
ncbi:HEPN domain-containing protein [Agrobacterium leguminum]|uniref:HEPN domain-containing protein n=1 Tax=Agrobacterium leguminum TaxID=2792015 RepID=UPI003CE54D8C